MSQELTGPDHRYTVSLFRCSFRSSFTSGTFSYLLIILIIFLNINCILLFCFSSGSSDVCRLDLLFLSPVAIILFHFDISILFLSSWLFSPFFSCPLFSFPSIVPWLLCGLVLISKMILSFSLILC